MPAVEPGKIRNVAVVGHRGTGKTSLVEAMLFQAGATNRLGSVEQASTVTDWDEDEQRRQMSLSAALCHLEWQGRKINLIDTPGDPGFQADTLASLRVVEGALMVVSGVAGVEVLGEKVTIVHTRDEAAAVKLRGRIAVMSQTTQSMENFRQIVGDLALRTKELKVVNTLCPAITVRQEEAEVMVEEVEALVVIGGHHSANTTRLAEIGRGRELPTYHIEVPDELDPAWFSGVRKVGVMSGASTPEWIIAEVLQKLEEIGSTSHE